MLLKDNTNNDLSKDCTLRILTCELGLPVSKFVLNHFSVELSKMESKVSFFKRLVHRKLFEISGKILFSKHLTERTE